MYEDAQITVRLHSIDGKQIVAASGMMFHRGIVKNYHGGVAGSTTVLRMYLLHETHVAANVDGMGST